MDSPFRAFGETSISRGFRDALLQVSFASETTEDLAAKFYVLGQNSYFAESAYRMDGWQHRYWGEHYEHLIAIKRKYDPLNGFWCRHCVGSEPGDSDRLVSDKGIVLS